METLILNAIKKSCTERHAALSNSIDSTYLKKFEETIGNVLKERRLRGIAKEKLTAVKVKFETLVKQLGEREQSFFLPIAEHAEFVIGCCCEEFHENCVSKPDLLKEPNSAIEATGETAHSALLPVSLHQMYDWDALLGEIRKQAVDGIDHNLKKSVAQSELLVELKAAIEAAQEALQNGHVKRKFSVVKSAWQPLAISLFLKCVAEHNSFQDILETQQKILDQCSNDEEGNSSDGWMVASTKAMRIMERYGKFFGKDDKKKGVAAAKRFRDQGEKEEGEKEERGERSSKCDNSNVPFSFVDRSDESTRQKEKPSPPIHRHFIRDKDIRFLEKIDADENGLVVRWYSTLNGSAHTTIERISH